jgi:hypothetical protein
MEFDPEYYPSLIQPAGYVDARYYDLAKWVEQTKLGWLNISDPNLSLELDKNKPLPEMYRAIQGRRKPYAWRKGKIR